MTHSKSRMTSEPLYSMELGRSSAGLTPQQLSTLLLQGCTTHLGDPSLTEGSLWS